jgi:hypothetical protein
MRPANKAADGKMSSGLDLSPIIAPHFAVAD